ncbi:MAG: molecular chaperone Tir [Candidatus Synechococcus spongiarum 142]|uniref:Molecular chaperone Tir n=1 Tax=Candidatus Synechococcus spongiarum 142 TaxID=1608213 RepID=A0A6N3X485_9SYNE|nr:MAG: molecular chaperone Tir [Candidatus Synechococcus spongiarum 142]
MTMTYHLFISHSWSYEDQYHGLIGLLESKSDFRFCNHSVSKDNPIHNASNDRELREAIKDKMQLCSVILILAGIYSTYSKWINKEIDLAKDGFNIPKPIVAVEPRGSERASDPATKAAQEVVKWNSQSIIDAIRRVVR